MTTEETPSYDEVLKVIEPKRVFLGRLPEDTSEEELFQLAEEFGFVEEVKVVRGKRVGYVTFDTWASAHSAVLALNDIRQLAGHTEGQTIRAKFSERKGLESKLDARFDRGFSCATVFVGGLQEHSTDDDLIQLMEPFGEIREVRLAPSRSRLRCGFVTFALWGQAMDACERMNGLEAEHGATYKVEIPRRERDAAVGAPGAGEAAPGRARAANRHNGAVADAGVAQSKDRTGLNDTLQRVKDALTGPLLPRSEASARNEFEQLKEEYLRALDAGKSREMMDRLHKQLMDARDRSTKDRRLAEREPSKEAALRPPPVPGKRPLPAERPPPQAADRRSERPRSRSRTRPRTPRRGGDREEGHRLWISCLPSSCTDEHLSMLVEHLPPGRVRRRLLECTVKAGRGVLVLDTREAAEEVFKELHERQVKGWPERLRAQWVVTDTAGARGQPPEPARGSGGGSRGRGAERPASGEDGRRVFVGGLLAGNSIKDHLVDICKRYGRVEECLHYDGKGFAYVTFRDARDVEAALKALHGAVVRGLSLNAGLTAVRAKLAGRPH